MGDVEFEKRVEEEALKTDARLCEYRAWGPSRAMVEAVRPLVERLAAAEADRDGLADNMRLAQERIRELEADRGDLSADDVDRLRRAIYAGPEESTLAAAERVSKALAAEREARPDLEQTIGKLTDEIRALRHESSERLVRCGALEGERDQALSTVTRYRVQLAEVVGREAALRSALADYRAGQRALARDLLGVEVAGRRVEEVGS